MSENINLTPSGIKRSLAGEALKPEQKVRKIEKDDPEIEKIPRPSAPQSCDSPERPSIPPSPFASPPRTYYRSPAPSTPRHPSKKKQQLSPFSPTSEQLTVSKLNFTVPEGYPWVEVNGRVSWGENQHEVCVKQPPQSQSCGMAAIVMLLEHYKNTFTDLDLLEGFWEIYTQYSLLSAEDIIKIISRNTNIEKIGYEVQTHFYSSSLKKEDCNPKYTHSPIDNYSVDLLNKLKGKVDMEGSLIVSITNQKIAGHWILIDKVTESEVYIRDPFLGQAYKLSHQEMFKNWECGDPVKSIGIVRSM